MRIRVFCGQCDCESDRKSFLHPMNMIIRKQKGVLYFYCPYHFGNFRKIDALFRLELVTNTIEWKSDKSQIMSVKEAIKKLG